MTDVRDIARAAVPYGLATVELHRILVDFALDPSSPEYKGPLNTVCHSRATADPRERALGDLHVDMPSSYAWLDLRGGPVLLTMPGHEPDRHMSAQVVDLYSYILGYVSPRTTGPTGGVTAIVRGPSSPGPEVEADATFLCPTELSLVLVRTQLFDDDDRPAVAALQDAIVLEPLGPPGKPLTPPAPVDVRAGGLDERFLEVLDWMLQLMPRLPEDEEIRRRLSEIGCGTGRFDPLRSPTNGDEVVAGLADGFADVVARSQRARSSAELFGSREFFAGDHTTRAAGAFLGILDNAA